MSAYDPRLAGFERRLLSSVACALSLRAVGTVLIAGGFVYHRLAPGPGSRRSATGMSERRVRRRWLLLPVALLATGVGVALAVGPVQAQPPSVEHLRAFDRFSLFYPGDGVGGYRLRTVLADGWSPYTVAFIYGTCESSGSEGGCAAPLSVQVWSACARFRALYLPENAPPPLMRRRGVQLYGGGDIEFQTGDATVVVFAWTPELALEAIDALRGLNVPIAPDDPLPPPVPGAFDGTLECESKPSFPPGFTPGGARP